MSGFDPYSSLGVGKNASPEEIKKAYRTRARKYHPDHNPNDSGAEEKFKEVKKAYDILSDPHKRQQYDNYGYTGDEQPGAGGFGGFGGGGFGFNFEDIFDSMFGEGFGGRTQSRQRAQRGSDIGVELTLSFEEAVFGKEKEISVRVLQSCDECQGSGAKSGTEKKKCSHCQGSGEIKVVQNTILGRMVQVKTCPHCNGQGLIITQPCPNCRGQGRVEGIVRKKINIPAGVDKGTRLRIAGGGDAGIHGGGPGDLYVNISIRPHRYFQRKGQDIHITVPIGLAQAALGVELDVPTLEGTERLVVPAGTRSGANFRFAGRGVVSLNRGGKGNQIVTVEIEVPKNLTPEQREALRKYAGLRDETVENIDNGLLGRLKRAFGRW